MLSQLPRLQRRLQTVCILAAAIATATGCGSGATAATSPTTTTTTTIKTPTSDPTGALTMKMYSSTSATGSWASQTVTITGSDALGLVDPSPILMPDGTILLYYLMSYITGGDPASAQPNNQWKMGVALSTDNGLSFTHQATAFTFDRSTTDPFPMLLANGTIRLLASQGSNVPSVTATDATGLHFSSTLDAGLRVSNGGIPGALRIGGTYYLYGCGTNGILYSTSTDGLNFSTAGTAIPVTTQGTLCDPSPIDAGGGSYLMSFKRGSGGGPQSDFTYMASSTDGKTWTDLGLVGQGSVPGLVKDRNGVLRIYVPGA